MKINLGAGNLIMEDYINHDIVGHRPEIQLIFDLNDKDWSIFVNDCDEIRAWDVLEHIDDPLNFMDNCWNLLRKGGILNLKVCGWRNPNAHVDITHKRPGFDIRSFDYFVPTTEIGKEYSYYTDKKWKFVEEPHLDRNANVLVKMTPIK